MITLSEARTEIYTVCQILLTLEEDLYEKGKIVTSCANTIQKIDAQATERLFYDTTSPGHITFEEFKKIRDEFWNANFKYGKDEQNQQYIKTNSR